MSISREVLAKYVKPGSVFVETGTRWGLTVIKALELGAAAVHSIERDPIMYDLAKQIIADACPKDFWRVHLYLGDSGNMRDFPEIPSPVVFFLDAHDAGSPLLDELSSLVNAQDTILIDDMRIVRSGQWGFGLKDVLASLKDVNPDYKISYETGVVPEDILVAQP